MASDREEIERVVPKINLPSMVIGTVLHITGGKDGFRITNGYPKSKLSEWHKNEDGSFTYKNIEDVK